MDINGDSLMIFKNGTYVMTVDNGRKETTGFNQESSINKRGEEVLGAGQAFTFNDISLDREKLKSGKMSLDFISHNQVDEIVNESGILEQDILSRWGYAATQSNAGNERGKGKMDFKGSVRHFKLSVINGVGYNDADAGNYLWGYAMGKMGFTKFSAWSSSNMNAWWSAKQSNGQASSNPNVIMRWIENRSWSGDSEADQKAIMKGLNDSGSYWDSKLKTLKNLWK